MTFEKTKVELANLPIHFLVRQLFACRCFPLRFAGPADRQEASMFPYQGAGFCALVAISAVVARVVSHLDFSSCVSLDGFLSAVMVVHLQHRQPCQVVKTR